MSIITDFRKTVRSRIVGDRAVLAVSLPEPVLRTDQLEIEAQDTNVLAATGAAPPKDALGAYGPIAEVLDGPKTKEPSKPKIRTESGRHAIQPGRGGRPARMVGANLPSANSSTHQDLAGPTASGTAAPQGADPTPTSSALNENKSAIALRLLRRAEGAALTELMDATGWQAHSVRGFLSGTARKKLGLNLISETDGDGARRYRIVIGDGGCEPGQTDGSKPDVGAPKKGSLLTEPMEAGAATSEQVS